MITNTGSRLGNILASKLSEIEDIPSTQKISIYGPGNFLGEDDFLLKYK